MWGGEGRDVLSWRIALVEGAFIVELEGLREHSLLAQQAQGGGERERAPPDESGKGRFDPRPLRRGRRRTVQRVESPSFRATRASRRAGTGERRCAGEVKARREREREHLAGHSFEGWLCEGHSVCSPGYG